MIILIIFPKSYKNHSNHINQSEYKIYKWWVDDYNNLWAINVKEAMNKELKNPTMFLLKLSHLKNLDYKISRNLNS